MEAGHTLREVAVEATDLDPESPDQALTPRRMAGRGS
ncbi:MAG: hypothetical protein KC656_03065 [Myxococcales bacterium]|nr:hypothetical protein [Myxococcales bacterium]